MPFNSMFPALADASEWTKRNVDQWTVDHTEFCEKPITRGKFTKTERTSYVLFKNMCDALNGN